MSTAHLLILGAIAGLTIYLGLPMGRLRNVSASLRAFLNAIAIGVLVFLLWDVLSGGWVLVERALDAARENRGTWFRFADLATMFFVFFAIGSMGLVYYDRWMFKRAKRKIRQLANTSDDTVEALVVDPPVVPVSAARRLAIFIALGIGVHNFAEGLAIGQSAGNGEITLALMLIIGFGLHNATEGFGIVAPLATEEQLPSWRFLGALGLIGGGPTFLGTVVGRMWVNDALFVAFLSLAAGSIFYVITQLLYVGRKLGSAEITMWGILVGIFAGFITDLVLHAAGA